MLLPRATGLFQSILLLISDGISQAISGGIIDIALKTSNCISRAWLKGNLIWKRKLWLPELRESKVSHSDSSKNLISSAL